MQQADMMLCFVENITEKQKRATRTYGTEKKEKMDERKWETGQWNTYDQLPGKYCVKEETSKEKNRKSESGSLLWLCTYMAGVVCFLSNIWSCSKQSFEE